MENLFLKSQDSTPYKVLHHILLFIAITLTSFVFAQKKTVTDINVTNLEYFKLDTIRNKEGGKFLFKVNNTVEALDIPNQGRTGTCWSFSSLSFFEAEILKNKGLAINLSEMFIVRNAYIEKAIRYVRMHGAINFAQGGAFHDISHIIKLYGIVPQEVYLGKKYNGDVHNHSELESILKSALDNLITSKKLSTVWLNAIVAIVDSYLGTPPSSFTYKGKEYTPKSFTKYLGLDMENYIEISSFTHHPFYSKFTLLVPDNWLMGSVYNVPINEMTEVIDYALKNKYSLAWGSDISEPGFSFKNGMAVVPKKEEKEPKKKKKDEKKWFSYPIKEKNITQEMRQIQYDNYQTTDDHGMHIIGTANDQSGKAFYIVKNSWGKKRNDTKGYLFASKAYVSLKTIDILVNKNAIPTNIKKKLNIQ